MHDGHRARRPAVIAPLLALFAMLAASPARAVGEGEGQDASPGILTMGGLYLFYNEQAPLSFVSPVPSELPRERVELGEVAGRSCQHGLSIPTALSFRATNVSGAAGNGGYFKALESIRKAHPGIAGIYDVRTDLRSLSILGLYRRLCVEIVARGYARK